MTSIDISKFPQLEDELLVLGAENGDIQIWKLSKDYNDCQVFAIVPMKYCPGASVKRVQWRPIGKNEMPNIIQFASCSEDHSVRILSITL